MKPNPNATMLDDRSIASDVLSTTKVMTDSYAKSAIESATPGIRQTLASFYMEGLSCNEKVFKMMQNRGWYNVSKADHQQISQMQSMFEPNITSSSGQYGAPQYGQSQSFANTQHYHGGQSNVRY